LSDACVQGRHPQHRAEVTTRRGKRAQLLESLAHRSLTLVEQSQDAVDTERLCEEQPREEGLLRLQALERSAEPLRELGSTHVGQRVHPTIRLALLRDRLGLDRAVCLETVEGAVDLRLVGVPEVGDGSIERTPEVVPTLRSDVEEAEDGVPEL